MDDKNFDDLKVAQDWIQTIESDGARVRDLDVHPKLNRWIDTISPREILDLGCGQGVCSEKIQLSGRNYTGVDPSLHMMDRARELYPQPNRRFIAGNIYQLPLPNDAFDAAFSIAVWHLLSDIETASREVARVLKSGAGFLIISSNPATFSIWSERYTEKQLDGKRFEGCIGGLRDVLYLHSLDEILDSLRAAGLQIDRAEAFRDSKLISVQGTKKA